MEKKTYPFWDGTIGRAVDIELRRHRGRSSGSRPTVHRTQSRTSRSTSAEGVAGTYDNVVTVNVDPTTGSIVKTGQDQQRFLEDGTQVLDIQMVGTDDTVKDAVDEAKTNGSVADHTAHRASRSSASVGGRCACIGRAPADAARAHGGRSARRRPRSDKDKVGAGA